LLIRNPLFIIIRDGFMDQAHEPICLARGLKITMIRKILFVEAVVLTQNFSLLHTCVCESSHNMLLCINITAPIDPCSRSQCNDLKFSTSTIMNLKQFSLVNYEYEGTID